MSAKRKRTDLALVDKVVNMLHENESQTEIAAKFGISRSQVSIIGHLHVSACYSPGNLIQFV